jgi:dipeptidyl aminopeptidase/acylaminoacyl peptidase
VINADGGGALTKISDHDESDNQPRWSPDGKWIAFTGELHDRDHPKIWLAPATGGVPSTLAANNLDLIPGGLQWSDDGKSLYFETGVKGELHLFRVDVPTKSVSQVTSGARGVRSADFNFATGKMIYLANDFKHLDDLYSADLNGKNERKLTNLNEALWKQLHFADVERFTYKSADDWDIDGFLVKPLGWQEGKKYPLVLSVHGGPAGAIRRRLVSRISGLCGEGLRGAVYQPARVDRLWPKVRARHRQRMGRQGLSRRDERARCRTPEVSVDRSESFGCDRRQLWRLHDQLDCRPYRSLQSSRDAAQRLELYFG